MNNDIEKYATIAQKNPKILSESIHMEIANLIGKKIYHLKLVYRMK